MDIKNNSKNIGRTGYGTHISLDEIDKVILSQLGRNADMPSYQIANELKDMGYNITDRVVRQRLQRLEKSNVVLGYSAILNPKIVSEKVNRTIILKFKFSENAQVLIDRLKNYLEEVPFCPYSARLTSGGDFDWICHFVYDSIIFAALIFFRSVTGHRNGTGHTLKIITESDWHDGQPDLSCLSI